MKVVGFEKRLVKSKQTGNEYEAALIYVEEQNSRGAGMRTESIFTTADRVPGTLQIGSEIRILYNRWGRVESIEVV